MSVREKILKFIEELKTEHTLFPYAYNQSKRQFDSSKDWVYYSGPVWDDREVATAIESLLTGKWLAAGERVALFEHAFSRRFGFAASLMVNSGSSANLVMLSALKKYFGWHDGDEIVTSAVGFPTTVAPLLQNNLRPVFTDIRMDDLNFDLEQVEGAIGPRTKAILISPVLGNPPDMDELQAIAKRKNVMLILDGCDSLGSKWAGQDLSATSFATSCSFYPAHHITTGEGGMVSSNDKEYMTVARRFAWWGRDCYCVGSANLLKDGTCRKRFSNWLEGSDSVIDHKYLFSEVGYNLKPLDLQGAIGMEQLNKLDMIHEKRRAIKNRIGDFLKEHRKDLRVPEELKKAETSWFGIPIVCETKKIKEKLVHHLESNRVQTRNYFAGNILLHPGYQHIDDARKYPNANRVLEQVFFIGCHPAYGEDVLRYIEATLLSAPRN